MTRHFCDICNKTIVNYSNSMEVSIGRQYSPNKHLVFQEICDECGLKLVSCLNDEVDKIRKEVAYGGKSNEEF